MESRLQEAQREMEARAGELLQLLGIQIISNVQIAYDQKSQGGQGIDGLTWKPLDPKTIKRKRKRGNPQGAVSIGIDTGLQRASIQFGAPDNVFRMEANAITVGYGREYSVHFDKARTLIPDVLPDDWLLEMDQIARDWADDITREALE